jgi:type 1 glutamine amidotransferase
LIFLFFSPKIAFAICFIGIGALGATEFRRVGMSKYALLASMLLAASGVYAQTPAALKSSIRNVLYFTHSASYFHEIIPYSSDKMKAWAQNDGSYAIKQTDDCSIITPENLAKFDCVVFYTNRELPISEPNRKAILDYVKSGGGFIAIHSGTGTFFEWPPYQEMINGIFDGHPWSQTVRIKIEAPGHSLMKGVPETVTIEDEIYQHKNWERARTYVLASLDVSSVDLNAKGVNRTDKDFGIAWAHRYGKGRVYVNALGHTKAVWDAPWFEKMIVQGVHWAMGDTPLDLPENAETGKSRK